MFIFLNIACGYLKLESELFLWSVLQNGKTAVIVSVALNRTGCLRHLIRVHANLNAVNKVSFRSLFLWSLGLLCKFLSLSLFKYWY